MNKVDILRKIDSVNKYNQIIKLKKENELKEKKFKKIQNETKKIMNDYYDKNKAVIEEKDRIIQELEIKYNEAKTKEQYYKGIIDSIPNFIVRLFYKKNKK